MHSCHYFWPTGNTEGMSLPVMLKMVRMTVKFLLGTDFFEVRVKRELLDQENTPNQKNSPIMGSPFPAHILRTLNDTFNCSYCPLFRTSNAIFHGMFCNISMKFVWGERLHSRFNVLANSNNKNTHTHTRFHTYFPNLILKGYFISWFCFQLLKSVA